MFDANSKDRLLVVQFPEHPMKKISARDYYDTNPSLKHQVGDIWADVPLHGLLGQDRGSVIIITPACDLAQSKVDTITYLPIISIKEYFSSSAVLPEVRKSIDGQLSQASLSNLIDWPQDYGLPTSALLDASESLITERLSGQNIPQKVTTALLRVQAGLRIVRQIIARGLSDVESTYLNSLFGEKEWLNVRQRMIANSYKTDLHFLPSDGQKPEWSGVLTHSVALFRCPMSAPLQLFDAAQDISISDWPQYCRQIEANSPYASRFLETRPMKRLTLQPNFASDMLTRYVSLYVRVGSPDFTPETVLEYCSQL
jgi:hypothetical protein